MAKGRANPSLVIAVADAYKNSPPIESLRQQGHQIIAAEQAWLETPDLILHPAAHQWNDMQWDFLEGALVAARKRKKGAKR